MIYRFWKISLRKEAATDPGEVKDTYDDFKHDERLHGWVADIYYSSTSICSVKKFVIL